jgi:hypothetical protein
VNARILHSLPAARVLSNVHRIPQTNLPRIPGPANRVCRSGARSVGESSGSLRRCQARSCIRNNFFLRRTLRLFSSIARSGQPFAFTPHVQLIPPPARRDVAAAIAARDGPDST